MIESEFKQAIRAGKIEEAFLVAMSNAPELNITTKIITAEGKDVEGSQNNYLHTHINLIEGKIENEIGEKLIGDRYSEIKQFHMQQVTQGHQTIQQNLISLQRMFQLMSSFKQQASEHTSWVDIAADVTRDLSAKASQLYGKKVPNALEAGETNSDRSLDAENNSRSERKPPEAEEDDIVQDLLSMTDEEDDSQEDNSTDWSEWLDDEPDVETKVFNLESLSDRDSEIWQNWESENQAIDDVDADSSEEEQ